MRREGETVRVGEREDREMSESERQREGRYRG